MRTSRLAMMSMIALFVMVSGCTTPNDPKRSPTPEPPLSEVEPPRNVDAPAPPGAGWVLLDTTHYKATLANFTIVRNVISFDINAVHPNGCIPQTTFTQALNGNVFAVKTFFKPQDSSLVCTPALKPFSVRVFLSASTGTYRVRLHPPTLSQALDTTVTIP